MIDIGRICVKIAGRDAGKKCVVIDVLDENTVLIDGETRRRKCNIMHLEPLDKTVEIKKNASHEEVTKVFESLGYGIHTTKPKKTAPRPRRARKSKLAGPAEAKPAKKGAKAPVKKTAEVKPTVKNAPVKTPEKPKAETTTKKGKDL